MARTIQLKTTKMSLDGSGGPTVPLSWANLMEAILKHAPPQKGLMLDDVIKAVDAIKPLAEAMKSGASEVTFSEEQYRLLRTKLDEFPFAVATPEIAEFGLAIRNATEAGLKEEH